MFAPILLLAAATAAPASPATLDDVLRAFPADALVEPLRAFESEHQGVVGAEAAFSLGQLHYTRGEYRAAADAFGRAAARFEPARKPEARYWLGLAYLALKETDRARGVLDEVSRGGPRRAEALFALAHVWEAEQRPERALEVLTRLTGEPPSEVTPAALERVVALASGLGRADVAKQARVRLEREYAGAIEAARLEPARDAAAAANAPGAAQAVVLGPFSDAARARALAATARRNGFRDAAVAAASRGAGDGWLVRLGRYRDVAGAREAGERAAALLGVPYRVEAAR